MPNEFRPEGSILFGWLSALPLLFLANDLRDEIFPWRWGALWGIGFTGFQYFWLSRFGDFSVWTLGGVALVYALYGSLFLPFLSFVLKRSNDRTLPFLSAGTLVGFEYLRSIGYLGFPWNLIVHPFSRWVSFIQIVDLGGVFLLGFIILYTQGTMFLWLRNRKCPWVSVLVSGALVVSTFIYGEIRLQQFGTVDRYADTSVDLILVQQNEDSWSSGAGSAGLARLQDLTLQGLETRPVNISAQSFEERPFTPELGVWSETSLAYSPESLLRAQDRFPETYPFGEFMSDFSLPLLTGAPVFANPQDPRQGLMNGAVLFTPEGQEIFISDTYGKKRLIPFAEHVPLGNIPFLSRFLEERIGISASGWVHGPDSQPLNLSLSGQTLQVGIPICFEDSFFQHIRLLTLEGSHFFINLTNNSWSGTFTAHGQHTAAAIFRTIETRRTMIRSTNSGLTSVIGPQGRILFRAPEFTAQSIALRIPLQTQNLEITAYTRYGDWFPVFLLGMLFLFLVSESKFQKKTTL